MSFQPFGKLPLPCAFFLRRFAARLSGVILLVLLAACGPATMPPGDRIADVDERQNRAMHQFNVALDRTVVAPVSRGYGTAVPAPVRQGVSNFAANLSQPSYVLNNILQVRLGQATQNTLRFLLNSTIGIGGLFDPATALGVPARETDFGETLHVYGIGEGDFIMLPVFGPSTTRDTVGLLVDIATDPVRHVVAAPDRRYASGADVLDRLGDRHDNDDAINSLLYESADGYAQLRSLYLQNRRFRLGGAAVGFDPATGAGDLGASPYADPYADPYVDAYAP